MVLDYSICLSWFALGLFISIVASLINITISAFARWVMEG